MRIAIGFLLISIFSFSTFAQKELTLPEAVKIALQRNPTLQKTENNIRTFEANKKAAIGGFLPSVNAGGGFNWTRSEDEGGIINIGGVVFNTPPQKNESRTYSANVSTQWTLFDGLSNFATLSQSKNDLDAAKYSLKRLKQDIVFQTISLYYDVINKEQLLKFREDDVKWNKRNLETIQERNKLGAVTLADVYAQQVKVGNAELEVIRAKNNLETAKSTLLSYLGLDVLEPYTFSDSLTSQEREILGQNLSKDFTNISYLVEEALKDRYDYESIKLGLESASDAITIARAGFFPRLTNSFSYNLRSNRFENILDSRTYSVNLNLSISLFSGFSTQSRVEAAIVNAENKKVELEDLERQIKRNLQKTFLDLQAAEKALDVSRRNVKAAEENRKIEQEKYNLGAGTLLNVLIANSDYTNALTNYINSQFEYIKLSEQLKYDLGTLDYQQYEQN